VNEFDVRHHGTPVSLDAACADGAERTPGWSSPAQIGEGEYVAAVLERYICMPETPSRAFGRDVRRARVWYRNGIPLTVVVAALVLGNVRRCFRDPSRPALQSIRGLDYFEPVVEELVEQPIDEDYLAYLQAKLDPLVAKKNGNRA
jgi:hypothetical protein